jgi:hypothetical protein
MPGKQKYTLGSKAKANEFHDITLPSGATCQARRPGVQGLISIGILDSFDELTALVQTEHIGPNTTGGPGGQAKVTPDQAQAAGRAILADKDKLATTFWLMDSITAYCITTPSVWIDYQTKDETEDEFNIRSEQAAKDGSVAVREIDLDDKMFILSWAMGGTSDLAAFRQGTQELMGSVEAK